MLKIRYANKNDTKLLLNFIKDLAKYEKMINDVKNNEELINKWLFEKQVAKAFFILEDNIEIGFVIYFYNYSTFVGKPGLYVEDIFIKEQYRNKGYGKLVFQYLAKKAYEEGCGRMEWVCLDWNESGIKFYQSLGAEKLDEWLIFRLTAENIKKLV